MRTDSSTWPVKRKMTPLWRKWSNLNFSEEEEEEGSCTSVEAKHYLYERNATNSPEEDETERETTSEKRFLSEDHMSNGEKMVILWGGSHLSSETSLLKKIKKKLLLQVQKQCLHQVRRAGGSSVADTTLDITQR